MPRSPPSRRNHSPASRAAPEKFPLATNSGGQPKDEHSDSAAGSMPSANVRGALSPEEQTSGDTLLPMLVGGLVLIVLAVIALFVLA